jgi:hypothetical protein
MLDCHSTNRLPEATPKELTTLTHFDKLQYLRLLDGDGKRLKPPPTDQRRALDYAAEVWLDLDLRKRPLEQKDIVGVFRHGGRSLFHIKAYPRKTPSVVVIVVVNGKKVEGHILIDLAADGAEPTLECPLFDFEGVADASDIEKIIPSLDAKGRDPFSFAPTARICRHGALRRATTLSINWSTPQLITRLPVP